jgi:hypothetical protein
MYMHTHYHTTLLHTLHQPVIHVYYIIIYTSAHAHTLTHSLSLSLSHTHNSVEAELTAVSESKVVVQFKKFNLFGGIVSFKAPQRARGELDTTYLDR